MVIECPHCLTTVIPDPEGICPACRRNTRDTAGTDPTRTRMKIGSHERLPMICFHCARAADLVYRVVRSRSVAPSDTEVERMAVVSLLSVLVGQLLYWFRGRESIIVELPICHVCSTTVKPTPDHVDFGNNTMTFVVHRTFKEQAHGRSTP